MFKQGIGQKL